MSRVRAVIAEPPSLPLNIMSLSEVVDLITKSVDELVSSPKVVPASFNNMSAPSASRIISPALSSVRSPLDKSISVPSIVMLSITTPAFAVTAPPTAKVDAISTAPSMSTTSRLAVPFTSIEPSKSISPLTIRSSVTVKSSSTFRSTTFKLAKASTIAAPEPAPSEYMALVSPGGMVTLAPLPCEIIIF